MNELGGGTCTPWTSQAETHALGTARPRVVHEFVVTGSFLKLLFLLHGDIFEPVSTDYGRLGFNKQPEPCVIF